MEITRPIIPLICPNPNREIYSCGSYNGYIAIPMEIWNKIKLPFDEEIHFYLYDCIPDLDILPHGGWTYAEEDVCLMRYHNHIPLIDIRNLNINDYCVIGFDTCHHKDNDIIWNTYNVIDHTFALYDSVIEYIKNYEK